jgi:MoaA/NifB/PqqE/SkfB family radical SAM enzyme
MGNLYEANLRLSQTEYLLQHIHLRSRPRCLGLVLSNRCNIACIHCYQSKNGDNLLEPPSIGQELRREFIGLYPYLSTLRLQGGELFVIPGFRDLLDDVAATVDRPILSISTNATLIDDEWAERIVRTPFQNVTVSIDAGTPATYARLRRGGNLETVLANVRRLQGWKERLASTYPCIDGFFVVMRSNFREIPQFLALMKEYGISRIAFQMMQISRENQARIPLLSENESIVDHAEVVELHAILRDSLRTWREPGQDLQFSGLTALFEQHGLDGSLLDEDRNGLYPNNEGLHPAVPEGAIELCPNPWTTLFVTEAGDVHLCFLSAPVGNLYQEPLADIWNSPAALAKRSRMIAGKYVASGCSSQLCSWRDGKRSSLPGAEERAALLSDFRQLVERAFQEPPEAPPPPSDLAAVRRRLLTRDRRIAELESLFQQLCAINQSTNDQGQAYIDHLEELVKQSRLRIEQLEKGLTKSVTARFCRW